MKYKKQTINMIKKALISEGFLDIIGFNDLRDSYQNYKTNELPLKQQLSPNEKILRQYKKDISSLRRDMRRYLKSGGHISKHYINNIKDKNQRDAALAALTVAPFVNKKNQLYSMLPDVNKAKNVVNEIRPKYEEAVNKRAPITWSGAKKMGLAVGGTLAAGYGIKKLIDVLRDRNDHYRDRDEYYED